jgi:hypothetical protein
MKVRLLMLLTVLLTGCSVFGQSEVEIAPYQVIKFDQQQAIEVRVYESMVLVSTSMAGDGRNSAFRKLFRYITGENQGATNIAMTVPVLMAEQPATIGTKIAMTAPVFISGTRQQARMAFVMPKAFTLETTPKPTNPELQVEEVRDYTVAAIRFNGTLSQRNIARYSQQLQNWLEANGYRALGKPVQAGYNGPLTLPMLRRNEILIEISSD